MKGTREKGKGKREKELFLFGKVHQHDIGVLTHSIEQDRLSVRCDVERFQYTLIAKVGERARRPRGEIEQPEVQRVNARQEDDAPSVRQETIATRTRPHIR